MLHGLFLFAEYYADFSSVCLPKHDVYVAASQTDLYMSLAFILDTDMPTPGMPRGFQPAAGKSISYVPAMRPQPQASMPNMPNGFRPAYPMGMQRPVMAAPQGYAMRPQGYAMMRPVPMAQPAMAQPAMAQPAMAQPVMVMRGSAAPMAQPVMVMRGSAGPMAQPVMMMRGSAGPMAQPVMVMGRSAGPMAMPMVGSAGPMAQPMRYCRHHFWLPLLVT
jgi:hypothetical protein